MRLTNYFTEIEGRGAELEQVVTAAEQRLEGPVNEVVIQEFMNRRSWHKNKSKQARAKLEVFEAELSRSE
jgi:hypothetical protein